MTETVKKKVALSFSEDSQIVLRRAELSDVKALMNITKMCFPDEIRWQIRWLARDYWRGVIHSPHSETWIWEVKGECAGFSQVLNDINAWIREKKTYDYGVFTKMLGIVLKPRIIARKISKNMWGLNGQEVYEPSKKSGMTENLLNKIAPENPDEGVTYGGVKINPDEVLWVELAGVLPEFRRYGIAIRSLRHSDELAKKRGRRAICGVIEETVTPWCALHERFGYYAILRKNRKFVFVKYL